jgi:hypothetical protein
MARVRLESSGKKRVGSFFEDAVGVRACEEFVLRMCMGEGE